MKISSEEEEPVEHLEERHPPRLAVGTEVALVRTARQRGHGPRGAGHPEGSRWGSGTEFLVLSEFNEV